MAPSQFINVGFQYRQMKIEKLNNQWDNEAFCIGWIVPMLNPNQRHKGCHPAARCINFRHRNSNACHFDRVGGFRPSAGQTGAQTAFKNFHRSSSRL